MGGGINAIPESDVCISANANMLLASYVSVAVCFHASRVALLAMPFPFGKSQKTPAELVKSLKEKLEELEASESKKGDKASRGSGAGCVPLGM